MSQPGLSPYWRKRRACAPNYTKKNKTIFTPAVVGLPTNKSVITFRFLIWRRSYGSVTCYYAIAAYNRQYYFFGTQVMAYQPALALILSSFAFFPGFNYIYSAKLTALNPCQALVQIQLLS